MAKGKTQEEIAEQIREAAEEGRIEWCESDGIDAFAEQADELLGVMGYPGSIITDRSDLTDFTSFGEWRAAELEELHAAIEERYGVDVRPEVNILAILRRVHNRPKGNA